MSRDTGHMCWGGAAEAEGDNGLNQSQFKYLTFANAPQATIFNYVNTFISQYLGRDSHKRTYANLNFVTFAITKVFKTFTLPPFPFFWRIH